MVIVVIFILFFSIIQLCFKDLWKFKILVISSMDKWAVSLFCSIPFCYNIDEKTELMPARAMCVGILHFSPCLRGFSLGALVSTHASLSPEDVHMSWIGLSKLSQSEGMQVCCEWLCDGKVSCILRGPDCKHFLVYQNLAERQGIKGYKEVWFNGLWEVVEITRDTQAERRRQKDMPAASDCIRMLT